MNPVEAANHTMRAKYDAQILQQTAKKAAEAKRRQQADDLVHDLLTQIALLEEKNDCLNKANADLNNIVLAKDADIVHLHHEMRLAQREAAKANEALEAAKKENARDIAQFEAQMKALKENHNSEVTSLKEALCAAKETADVSERDALQTKLEKADLAHQHIQAIHDRDVGRTELAHAYAESEVLRGEMNGKIADQRRLITEQQKVVDSLRDELTRAQADVHERTCLLNELHKELAATAAALACEQRARCDEVEKFNRDKQELMGDIDQLSTAVALMQEELVAAQEQEHAAAAEVKQEEDLVPEVILNSNEETALAVQIVASAFHQEDR